jgi:hypothetical protein
MPTTKHVTDLLHEQHTHIQALFDRVMEAPNRTRRSEAFEELRRYVAVHETAEEMITHPVARGGGDGGAVANQRLAEENVLKARLAELDELDVEDPEFAGGISQLRVAISQHMEHEEREEFPLLRIGNDDEQQVRLARAVEAIESVAPTRPHPTLGSSATSQLMIGPLASVIDRTRDAIRRVLG